MSDPAYLHTSTPLAAPSVRRAQSLGDGSTFITIDIWAVEGDGSEWLFAVEFDTDVEAGS